MSAPPDGLVLLRQIRAALLTREGRATLREIMGELQRADDEAREQDPVAHDVDRVLAQARRRERMRGRK